MKEYIWSFELLCPCVASVAQSAAKPSGSLYFCCKINWKKKKKKKLGCEDRYNAPKSGTCCSGGFVEWLQDMQILSHVRALTEPQWKYSVSQSLSWMPWCRTDYMVCEREENLMKWHLGREGPRWTSSFPTLLPSLSRQREGRHCGCERENSLCIENQKEARAPCSDSWGLQLHKQTEEWEEMKGSA